MGMRGSIRFALLSALVIVLCIVVIGAVWALPQNPYSSVLSLNLGDMMTDYSNSLIAEVTANQNGSYHYEYTLSYLHSAYLDGELLTEFSVANRNNLAFTNQGSDHNFVNGISQNSVLWISGNAGVGQTVKFWYDSIYSYKEVEVTLSGGLPSSGTTLGMVMPEPCSLIVMLTALGGLGFKLRRRKRIG
jgi:hypothetical protein